ncbi:aerobic-type carbon monoxide dehydrogenase small subunit (CoxS/CutS family) [Kibdelosporangium banguiense]|uniref:Aerobic-type carbon monoxide dehydrogenase small subunit (CoxS/CutS family) n=1 Tax=Kibdelosporangium banguiense TaxID=1365924 RepID=A0ABS4T781_9PSEU|nr:2Fe-2S iron-sulfur cluster-binding protein [Kibdelosporangium banguiense]MBP2320233.1 aerobic-type carbon monoxide dehydrogenase small subunit (CoxS/CutS family) [Kibdelosporangium banguiense]
MKLTVDGQAALAQPGQTIAAVLHTMGRGRLFCGIGVCFDCVVTVNGVSDVRACQRVAADGDDIRTVS